MTNIYFDRNLLQNERQRNNLFSFYLYLAYFAYFLSPIRALIFPKAFRFILYGTIILHSIHIQISQRKAIKTDVFFFLIIEFAFIISMYYGKWVGTQTLINYSFGIYLFWLPVLLFQSIIEFPFKLRNSLREAYWALFTIVTVTTIIGNIQYPGASRYLAASETPNAALYQLHNIGDYQVIYGVVLLVPYIMYELSNNKNNIIRKSFFTALLLLAFLLAIVTQYATSIIIYVVEFLIVIIVKAKNKTTLILKCIAFIALFYLIKDSIPSWLFSLRDVFIDADSNWLAERSEMLADFFAGNGTSGDMEDRGKLYIMSWQAFCQSPLFGNLLGGQHEIGGHSEMLDILGGTGIWGMVLFIGCLLRYVKQIVQNISKHNYCYIFASFVGFLILFSINTGLFPIIGIAEFVAAPLVMGKRDEKRTKYEDRKYQFL